MSQQIKEIDIRSTYAVGHGRLSSEKPVVIRTQRQLATLAGVSMTTVYNALHCKELVHEKTLEKIYQLMKEYDYHPDGVARAMVSGKTNVLGIIVPMVEVPYYAKLLSAIERATNDMGYNCIFCQHGDDKLKEERELRVMRERRVDGLIVRASGSRDDASVYRRLKESQTPFVLIDRRFEELDKYYVSSDDFMAAKQLVDYLVAKGHRRIGIVYWPSNVNQNGSRFDGYCEGLRQNGLDVDKRLMIKCAYEYFSGREETYELLRRNESNKPTAILACNDTSAIGVVKALRELNLNIPGDVAVVGIGGCIDMSLLPVQVTTAVLSFEAVAHRAVEMLFEQLNGTKWNCGPILVPAELRIGSTT